MERKVAFYISYQVGRPSQVVRRWQESTPNVKTDVHSQRWTFLRLLAQPVNFANLFNTSTTNLLVAFYETQVKPWI